MEVGACLVRSREGWQLISLEQAVKSAQQVSRALRNRSSPLWLEKKLMSVQSATVTFRCSSSLQKDK